MATPELGADMSGDDFVIEKAMPDLLADIEAYLEVHNKDLQHYPPVESPTTLQRIGRILYIGVMAVGSIYAATAVYADLVKDWNGS